MQSETEALLTLVSYCCLPEGTKHELGSVSASGTKLRTRAEVRFQPRVSVGLTADPAVNTASRHSPGSALTSASRAPAGRLRRLRVTVEKQALRSSPLLGSSTCDSCSCSPPTWSRQVQVPSVRLAAVKHLQRVLALAALARVQDLHPDPVHSAAGPRPDVLLHPFVPAVAGGVGGEWIDRGFVICAAGGIRDCLTHHHTLYKYLFSIYFILFCFIFQCRTLTSQRSGEQCTTDTTYSEIEKLQLLLN